MEIKSLKIDVSANEIRRDKDYKQFVYRRPTRTYNMSPRELEEAITLYLVYNATIDIEHSNEVYISGVEIE